MNVVTTKSSVAMACTFQMRYLPVILIFFLNERLKRGEIMSKRNNLIGLMYVACLNVNEKEKQSSIFTIQQVQFSF